MENRLAQPRYTKDSVQIIQLLSKMKQPATILEIVKEIKVQYNPEIINSDFWMTFNEKLYMGIKYGYIRVDQKGYSVVLPTIKNLVAEISNRKGYYDEPPTPNPQQ